MQNMPWHIDAQQKIMSAYHGQKLPHAIIVQGVPGVGKLDFARWAATSILCMNSTQAGYCGNCESCHLISAGSHPDYTSVAIEEKKSSIGVDQIRAVNRFLQLKAQQSGAKICVVEQADKMTISAANSLLKTLEEPSQNSFLILTASDTSRLLPTIKSRCQMVDIKTPGLSEGAAWLQSNNIVPDRSALIMADGAPLLAKKYIENNVVESRLNVFSDWLANVNQKISPVEVAQRWQALPFEQVYSWVSSFVSDTVKLKLGSQDCVANTDILEKLQLVAQTADIKRLFFKQDELTKMRQAGDIPLNMTMFWQAWLIK